MTETARILQFPHRGMVAPPPRRLVTLNELRSLYGFSDRWWRYKIAEGMPVHRWTGGSLRFDVTEVEEWMAQQLAKPSTLPPAKGTNQGRRTHGV